MFVKAHIQGGTFPSRKLFLRSKSRILCMWQMVDGISCTNELSFSRRYFRLTSWSMLEGIECEMPLLMSG